MKPNAAQLQAALKRLEPGIRLVLLFGPDEALIRERARAFATQVVADLNDPFAVVELDGKQVAEDPSRLADEAASLPFLGDAKLIRVTGIADAALPGVEALLTLATPGNLVVATAGDLAKTSRLRKLAEDSPAALAIACYAEEGGRLTQFLQTEAQTRGLSLDRDALELLIRAVGPERDIARNELDKLALYKGVATGGSGAVTEADLEAIGADFGQAGYDKLVNAVLGQRPDEVARQIDRLAEEGEAGIALLRAVSRRLWQLLDIRARMADGEALEAAIGALRPPVFWKEKELVAAQARRWSAERLKSAVARVLEAERAIKTAGGAGDVIAHQGLLALSVPARGDR